MGLESVDAPDVGRLAGTRRTDDDNHFTLAHRRCHTFERLEVAKPLLDTLCDDDRVTERSLFFLLILHTSSL